MKVSEFAWVYVLTVFSIVYAQSGGFGGQLCPQEPLKNMCSQGFRGHLRAMSSPMGVP
jgi:hypothetical protein